MKDPNTGFCSNPTCTTMYAQSVSFNEDDDNENDNSFSIMSFSMAPNSLASLLPFFSSHQTIVLVHDNARRPSQSLSEDANNQHIASHRRKNCRRKGGHQRKEKVSRWWNSMSVLPDTRSVSSPSDEMMKDHHHHHHPTNNSAAPFFQEGISSGLSSSSQTKAWHLPQHASSLPLTSRSTGSSDQPFRSSLEAKKPQRHPSDEESLLSSIDTTTNTAISGGCASTPSTIATAPSTPATAAAAASAALCFRSSLEAKKPRRQPSLTDDDDGPASSSSSSSTTTTTTNVPPTILEISQELSTEFTATPQDLTGRNLLVRQALRMPTMQTSVGDVVASVLLEDTDFDGDDECDCDDADSQEQQDTIITTYSSNQQH